MSFQQWMFLIVPNVAIIGMTAYIVIGLWLNRRDREASEQRNFEQHRRIL